MPHAGHGPVLKIDFRDFFPSIRSQDWVSYCHETNCIVDDEDIKLTASLLFQREKNSRLMRLAIGAPSSPMISNIIMYEFDNRISAILKSDKVVYTRYADDLTFSAPRAGHLSGVIKAVSTTIRSLKYPKLDINQNKTRFITPKYRRTVTGLTITNDARITIGREKKRELHAAVHHTSLGKLNSTEMEKLSGFLAFVKSVEPDFLVTLTKKYGLDVIRAIQHSVTINYLYFGQN